MDYSHKLDQNKPIKLADFDPSEHDHVDSDSAKVQTEKLYAELGDLQELLYAASMNSVLIVLQGMDTSGKDGTISHVFSAVNPQGCSVASFKQPTPLESAHDFLWRVHEKTPPLGMMTIYNRSHYEDVLVVRVHDLVPKDIWKKRYEQINRFEELLADHGTIILKFFLNISKEEQKQRLIAREDDPQKGWKLSPGDWKERDFWEKYEEAYEDVLSKTATEYAPWRVVPSNHKWLRNLAVADAIVHELRKYRAKWEDRLKVVSHKAREELKNMRNQQG